MPMLAEPSKSSTNVIAWLELSDSLSETMTLVAVVAVAAFPETEVWSPVLVPEILTSESAVLSCATVNEPKIAALPVDVMCPVKLAFVVTVSALPVKAPSISATKVAFA